MLFVSRSFCIVQLQHDYALCREKLNWHEFTCFNNMNCIIDANDLNYINFIAIQ